MAAWRAVVFALMLICFLPGSNAALLTTDLKLSDGFFNTKGLKLFHQNVRGLLSKFNFIEKLLYTHKVIDILGVTETHVDEDIDETDEEIIKLLFEITDYKFVFNNRSTGQVGGVGVYIKNGIDWKRRKELENNFTECIWLEIFFKHTKSLLVAFYYRPPNSSKHLSKNFDIAFNESLIKAQKEQKEVIILGDLNVNYLKNSDNKDLKTIINLNGFEQIITKPTRITETSETLIDVILTNNTSTINKVIVTSFSISDHEMIGCIRKLNCKKYKSRTITVRNYKQYDPVKLRNDVKNVHWDELYKCKDAEAASKVFTNLLKSVFDTHAPFTSKIVKGKPAPWLKKDLKTLMDKRDQALRKARKSKLSADFDAYKKLKNKCNSKLKETKRKYHRNLINENRNNPKNFWSAVKSVFKTKLKSVVSFSLNTSENEKTANTFSQYFGNVVKDLKNKLSQLSLRNYVWRKFQTSRKRTDHVFRFSYVSKVFVEI